MSNFIVAKGLGGGLLTTGGWGSDPENISLGVIKIDGGNLIIRIQKVSGNVLLTYQDNSGISTFVLPATAAQKAGTDWMIVKVSRSGSNLYVTLDKNEPLVFAIPQVVEYSGNVIFMDNVRAGLFDPRIVPRVITKTASDYYYDDVYDNNGKALLPNR